MIVQATRDLILHDLTWDPDGDGTYKIIEISDTDTLNLNLLDFDEVRKSLRSGDLKKAFNNGWLTKTDASATDGGALEITNAKEVKGLDVDGVTINDIPGLEDGVDIDLNVTIDLSALCNREASAASIELKNAIDAARLQVISTYTGTTEDVGLAAVTASLGTHETATTAIHGVGGSTIDSVANRDSAISTHAALTASHGAADIADVADIAVDANLSAGAQTVVTAGPCDVDGNLSVAAQDAVNKRHDQDTDQYLDFGGGNQSSAVDVADAVSKKHDGTVQDTALTNHESDTSTHGAADIADVADIAVDGNLSAGAQTVVTAGPCDVDANLSVAGQDAITKRHDGSVQDTALTNHGTATTGTHGVGANTIDSVEDRDSAISTHSGLDTGVHNVGGSTVASVADITTHTAIASAHHTKYTDADALAAILAEVFISTEQTGTGGSQDIAHGLGRTPTKILVSITDAVGAAAHVITEGAHDGTNLKITVTLNAKYKVWAM